MDVVQELMDVETASGAMAVLRTRPAKGSARPVGIFFDAPGIRTATHEYCSKLAAEGYDIVVPDLYHRHARLFHVEPAAVANDDSLVPLMRELMGTLDDDEIQSDMADAMSAAGFGPAVGCIGFCLGARAVHRAMTRHGDRFVAGAMWHPSFLVDDADDSPHLSVGDIGGPLYVGIGEDDKVQSIEMHQKWLDAAAGVGHIDVRTFDGADHGFSWPSAANYHDEAATTSFTQTTAIFARAL